LSYVHPYSFRFDPVLRHDVAKLAEIDGRTLPKQIERVLRQHVEARRKEIDKHERSHAVTA
jgi:hypothetical protein